MPEKVFNRFYYRCHRYIGPILLLFRPIRIVGRENLIEGSALVCANHSAMIDPLLVALSFKPEDNIHVMGKVELFRTPVVSWLVRKLGAICVDRSTLDVAAIKSSLKYLKNGEKVLIFPEGTRMSEFDAEAAKSGAVKLAERAGVPIIPVYIPRKKPFFKRSTLVFGKPYFIEKQAEKRTPEDYSKLSKELMQQIQALET